MKILSLRQKIQPQFARKVLRYGAVLSAMVGYLTSIVYEQLWVGGLLLFAALGFTALVEPLVRSYLTLCILGIGIMCITPVGTEISLQHMILMTGGMLMAVALPYFVARALHQHSLIHLSIRLHRKWRWQEIAMVAGIIAICTTVMAIYFLTTDAHHGWPLGSPSDLIIVFLSIMAIGIWEEFFFIGTVFGILKRKVSLAAALIIQALLFTAFLYQVGFRGWIVPLVFMYALTQGLIFHATKTLAFTLTIHVIVDIAVFILLVIASRT